MTYVMSDIHGQYEKYMRMLETIAFTDDDDLYVLGDVIDRGEHSVKILLNMSMRGNVFPILGNHEMMALSVLRKLCVEITDENVDSQVGYDDIKALTMWQMDGGDKTLAEFKGLDRDTKLAVIEYLEEFSPYEELHVNGREYLLVHGGVPLSKVSLPMEEQSLGEILTERPDYSVRYFEDKYLVTGHTPTVSIADEYDGKMYIKNGHIAIDCGAGFGKPLGCIRLEDHAEFYV